MVQVPEAPAGTGAVGTIDAVPLPGAAHAPSGRQHDASNVMASVRTTRARAFGVGRAGLRGLVRCAFYPRDLAEGRSARDMPRGGRARRAMTGLKSAEVPAPQGANRAGV